MEHQSVLPSAPDYDHPVDAAVARIIDANANRAREGLRVMEDHARFVLCDAALAERIKAARHQLSSLCNVWPMQTLLAARDAEADVGRNISTPQERTRADALAIARAAARRAGEALRCLEEFAKCESTEATDGFASLRYGVYEIEKRLLIGGPRMQRLRVARLHVLITEKLCRGAWTDVARAALAGGADVIQLREKSLGDRELLSRARELRHMTAQAGALLIVNDRPDIAVLADADGVHVGQDDLPVDAARRMVGPDRFVGVSTHDESQVRAALALAPDYIAVGPMFPSRTKPQPATPGPALLAAALRLVKAHASDGAPLTPLIAIGGITPENVAELMRTGGRSVAVTESVAGQPDPRTAAAAILAGLLQD